MSWDRTLENKNVNLSINIKDPQQWPLLLKKIKSEEVRKALRSILDKL